jgi:hypothetical protein
MKGVASLFFFLQPLISFFFLLMAVARAKGGRCVAMAGRGAGARVAPSLASSLLADVSRAGQVGAASRFSPCKRGMGAKRGSTMRARDWRGVRFRTLALDGNGTRVCEMRCGHRARNLRSDVGLGWTSGR